MIDKPLYEQVIQERAFNIKPRKQQHFKRLKDIAGRFDISERQVSRDIATLRAMPPTLPDTETQIVEEPVEENYDSDKWLRERTPETDRALLNACKSGNAQALKLYFQITNRLVEKQEIKVGITADEIARRNLEADRQLREGGYRVEEMQEEPPLLPE